MSKLVALFIGTFPYGLVTRRLDHNSVKMLIKYAVL